MLYYYGALLAWWVLVSVARVAREEWTAERKLTRMLPLPRDAKTAEATKTDAEAVRHALAVNRLIIVACDEIALYDSIRKDQMGDETVRVILDRRCFDRRFGMAAHVPDRRRGERRRHDIEPLLLTQGWAQVPSTES
jgi:hypothetical protein